MGPTAPRDSTPWFHTVIQIAENEIKPWPVMFVDDGHVGMTLQGRSLQMWIVMRKAEMIMLMAKPKDDTVIHRASEDSEVRCRGGDRLLPAHVHDLWAASAFHSD